MDARRVCTASLALSAAPESEHVSQRHVKPYLPESSDWRLARVPSVSPPTYATVSSSPAAMSRRACTVMHPKALLHVMWHDGWHAWLMRQMENGSDE